MAERLSNLGLGGDGDEIAAIEEVEATFGVRLDYSDAGNWSTVGDVYASLLRKLSAYEAARPDLWDRFAQAISRETGIDPSRVSLETGLLAEGRLWVHVTSVSAWIWVASALLIVAAVIRALG